MQSTHFLLSLIYDITIHRAFQACFDLTKNKGMHACMVAESLHAGGRHKHPPEDFGATFKKKLQINSKKD
jgi:hypothetical protein